MAHGPPPTPTLIKQLCGNPGQRKLNTNEPKPRAGFPDAPEHLGHVARWAWTYIKNNAPPGLITKIDLFLLEILCEEIELLRQAYADIKANVFPEEGSYVPSPHTVKNQAIKHIRQMCGEFGFSPAMRSRLTMPGGEVEDEFDSFLKFTG